jgi:hypothetical protein
MEGVMAGMSGGRLACAVAVALSPLVCSATQSIAAKPPLPAPIVVDLPAGLACPGFDLRILIQDIPPTVIREFTDRNGNVVRMLTAGKGQELTFINLLTNEELSLKANGAVTHVVFNPDGTRTETLTGHTVTVLFPTDFPAGPSTTLHVGRVVITIAPGEVATVQSVSGRSIDICAELSL